MSKPRTPEKINQDEFVSIGELAVLSGMRYSTLKYYTEIGILPFTQLENRLNRKYNKNTCLERLELIQKLKIEKRLTISEIAEYFR